MKYIFLNCNNSGIMFDDQEDIGRLLELLRKATPADYNYGRSKYALRPDSRINIEIMDESMIEQTKEG